MQLYYIFIVILLSVLTGPVLGLDTCDPLRFYLHTSKDGNCPSATIFFMSSPFTLEIDAEMGDNCNVRNQKSISLVFSDQTGSPFLQRDYPEEEYYFEYLIRWDEPRSHCIVDLVPDTSADPNWMMMDQNGILNNPYENLEPHAYKKVYTRRFVLDAKSPTRFRMAFTCSRDPSATGKPEQRAFIYGIKFGPVNKLKGADLILYKPAGKEYDCWRNMPQCNSEPPHKNASCVWVQTEEEPLSMWYYKGSWYMEEALNRPVSVPGNLFVDYVLSTVGAAGCIKPWHQDDITIGLRPDWPVDLVQSSKCKIPLYTIEERQRGLDVPQVFPYPRRGCKYSLKHDSIKRVSSGTTGTLSLLAPKAGWYLDCRKDKPQQDVDRTQTDQRQQQTETSSNSNSHTGLVILISMVIAAIVLYKRHQRNRNQPRVRLFAPSIV